MVKKAPAYCNKLGFGVSTDTNSVRFVEQNDKRERGKIAFSTIIITY